MLPIETRSFGNHQTTTASISARYCICAVLSRDVVELVHDGGGLWMQIGRGTWHRMSSKPDDTSSTYNDDLCSIVVNFVAVGGFLTELELLLLLLLPLLLSDTATLVENNDTNDVNDPYCVQSEGNLLRRVQRRLLSAVMSFFPRDRCCSFCSQAHQQL